ncbi:hypothetical protein HELRODRAFT_157726 [Helobdella robusta]|uniref:HMG box domain-containing protein n=1 Tax=Helobdella robusta TaxID=6412 RepID=T1EME7_HELRO|nr:hypothetical protein HELRODRAFT_157726 [Helobdella robusta]ESN95018.1 hypothetical protein HELRODRAFT_157726 [Helobdella robusta]
MGRAPKDSAKPKGKMSAYAFFMQATREERKKKNPEESLSLSEFSKQASEKWKNMSDKDKKKYEELAAKDSMRYKEEMADYVPTNGEKKRKRGSKDPNAPKRALSAFFCFSNEERAKVKAEFPSLSIGEVAKELGKRWEVCKNKDKYEAMAAKDKERYEKEKASYNGGSGASASAAAAAPAKKQAVSKKASKAKAKPPAKKRRAQKDDDDDEEEDDENHEDEEDDEEEEDSD